MIAKIAKKFRKGRKEILVKELLSMEQMLTYAGPELGECVAAHLARDAQAGTPEGVSYAGMAVSSQVFERKVPPILPMWRA